VATLARKSQLLKLQHDYQHLQRNCVDILGLSTIYYITL